MRYIIETVKTIRGSMNYMLTAVEADNINEAKTMYKNLAGLKRMSGKIYSIDDFIKNQNMFIEISDTENIKDIYRNRIDLAKTMKVSN